MIEDVIEQIESAMDEASEVIANDYMTAIRNPVARADRLGNLVNDEAILGVFQVSTNPDIFSVIPKGQDQTAKSKGPL